MVDYEGLDPKRKLIITGHSLGGAMATICAKRLSEEYENVHCLYTYGSPRVGGRKFVKSFLSSNRYRFRNVQSRY